jgi:uncharacterized protein YjbI with pentapeptide repeats
MDTAIRIDGRSIGEILRTHAQWMENESTGQRCILDGITLNGLNMEGANLQRAILKGMTFLDAELSCADLSRAMVNGGDFERAN